LEKKSRTNQREKLKKRTLFKKRKKRGEGLRGDKKGKRKQEMGGKKKGKAERRGKVERHLWESRGEKKASRSGPRKYILFW